jgi:hypothetical protein
MEQPEFTPKYFYVSADPTFDGFYTHLPVSAGTANVVAAATIYNAAFSKLDNPQGFPHKFPHTPTLSASGSMTFTSTTVAMSQFSIVNGMCIWEFSISGTTGGTAGVSLIGTAPIAQDVSATLIPNCGQLTDAAGVIGKLQVQNNNVYAQKMDGSNWGLGAGRAMIGTVIYPI